MKVPSGRIFDEDDLDLVRFMARYGFVRHEEKPFRLASGLDSHVYVFGREDLTDHPGFEQEVGFEIRNAVRDQMLEMNDSRQPCLIGIPTAGTPLAQAAAMVSRVHYPICHRIMRETRKEHGVHHTWVNGEPDLARHCYWLVDNVATNGDAKLDAARKFVESGYPPKEETPCLIFIDRQQGAVKRLEEAGFKKVVVVYNLLDITFALGELGFWPKSAVKSVEEEIHAHQFL